MDSILSVVKWAVESGPNFLVAVSGLMSAAITVALMIPGDQPEKSLQSVVDFLSKFSKKP